MKEVIYLASADPEEFFRQHIMKYSGSKATVQYNKIDFSIYSGVRFRINKSQFMY